VFGNDYSRNGRDMGSFAVSTGGRNVGRLTLAWLVFA